MMLGNIQHAADAMAAMAECNNRSVHIGVIPAATLRLIELKIYRLQIAVRSLITVVRDCRDRVMASLNS